jgi:hypothetical protein
MQSRFNSRSRSLFWFQFRVYCHHTQSHRQSSRASNCLVGNLTRSRLIIFGRRRFGLPPDRQLPIACLHRTSYQQRTAPRHCPHRSLDSGSSQPAGREAQHSVDRLGAVILPMHYREYNSLNSFIRPGDSDFQDEYSPTPRHNHKQSGPLRGHCLLLIVPGRRTLRRAP